MFHALLESVFHAKQRVGRGAARLDDRRPGWAGEIDVARLDLADNLDCTLGQLYRHYQIGRVEIGLPYDELTSRHGFTASLFAVLVPRLYRLETRLLRDAWVAEVHARAGEESPHLRVVAPAGFDLDGQCRCLSAATVEPSHNLLE